MSRILAFLAAVAVAALLAARVLPLHGAGARNPQAPPETEQFAFLIGEWECATRTMQPDGTMADGTARWTGAWILDGWAIQDDWASPRPDGTTFHGTNIRSFDPVTRVWDVRWLPGGTLQWSAYAAERVGETMVMTGGETVDPQGRSILDRNTFYDIGPDAWKWRKDRSFDAGATWLEGVVHVEARRVR